jgi:ribonuclease Z
MPVHPTEASWTLSTSASPDPLYQDKNLTVYGIPILPSSENSQVASPLTSDLSTGAQSLDHSLKRKREASPESPSKRPTLMAGEIGLLEKTPSLGDIIHQADFTPVGLTGETAQEWRRLMVDTMFPGVKEKMEAQKRKQRKERDRDRVPSPSKKSNDKNAGPGASNDGHSKSTITETNTCDNKGPTPLDGNNNSALSNSSNVSIY